MRLLLVEDEPRLARLLVGTLCEAGFAVDHAGSLEDARASLEAGCHDAVVLDRCLPDGDALPTIAGWRDAGRSVPVLVMTARDAVSDRVAGLDSGADDYLVKPFAAEELLARIRALLRRPGGALGKALKAGRLTFDTVERQVRIGTDYLALPRHELSALECLLRRVGRVVTRETLIEQLYAGHEEPASNAMPVHIHNLRRRLDAAQAGLDIVTFRGLGYMLRVAAP
jgi:DNA-binding response OmpR family regulator